MLSPQLLAVLRCPKCRGPLVQHLDAAHHSLDCHACKLRYPVDDEIPNLLIEEAQPLNGPAASKVA